ncbi:hypothetical protein [Thiobacillus sp.]
MPSSTAAAWPSPGRFALALIAGFALTLVVAWMWGSTLVEALLPLTHTLLGWIDDRFSIRFLGVEHNWQDTVVRLRLNFSTGFVLDGQVITPDPRGALWVTTPVGRLLQPLVIAPAIAAALPGNLAVRLKRFGLAALLALGFLVIDLPLTLHAVAWDMITYSLGVNDFSPLLAWYQFTQSGGKLGIGVLMGLATWKLR